MKKSGFPSIDEIWETVALLKELQRQGLVEWPFSNPTKGESMWLFILAIAVNLILMALGILSLAFPNPLRHLEGANRRQPKDFGLVPEMHSFKGLEAWLYRHHSAQRVVIVCHGRSRNKAYMLPLIAALVPHWNVFAFDFPSHGANHYGPTSIGFHEAHAVGHAIEYLSKYGFRDMVIYGVSMGGAALLLNQAEHPHQSVKALITDGTFASLDEVLEQARKRWYIPHSIVHLAKQVAGWISHYDVERIKPVEAAQKIRVPLLALHGERDPLVAPSSAERIAQAAPLGQFALYAGAHDESHNTEMHRLVIHFISSEFKHVRT